MDGVGDVGPLDGSAAATSTSCDQLGVPMTIRLSGRSADGGDDLFGVGFDVAAQVSLFRLIEDLVDEGSVSYVVAGDFREERQGACSVVQLGSWSCQSTMT